MTWFTKVLKNYEKGVANFPSLLLGGKLIPEKKTPENENEKWEKVPSSQKKKEGISESLTALSNRDSISRGNQVNNSLPEETVSAL